jgi:serpin B
LYDCSKRVANRSIGVSSNRSEPPGGDLFISKVKHKSFLDINEEGTEAAAATSVNIADSGRPDFEVTRPFLVVIREVLLGSILFMGRIMDPAG